MTQPRDSVDRRRFIRVKFPFTVHIYIPEKLAISAYTEDISEGGIKVTIKEKLTLHAHTDLEIFIQQEPILCKGKTAWVQQRESKLVEGETFYDTGIEFIKIKENDLETVRHHIKVLQKTKGFLS